VKRRAARRAPSRGGTEVDADAARRFNSVIVSLGGNNETAKNVSSLHNSAKPVNCQVT
jgi:hypothetical protein